MKSWLLKAKQTMVTMLILTIMLSTSILSSCGNKSQISDFYNLVYESQEYLDIVADDIYDYWYDAIYEDKYGSISLAVYYAKEANSENIAFIEANEPKIQELYKKVRDSKLSYEIKAVMSAYSDYYEFVINVSGSFETYKQGKETYKKALASALKELSLEM